MLLRSLPVAAVMALCTIGLARASDADFTLKNRTGYQIDEVYVSPHSSNSWGRDRMGSDALADGESVDIAFPHGGQACHFDIKVKYHDDNSTAEWGTSTFASTMRFRCTGMPSRRKPARSANSTRMMAGNPLPAINPVARASLPDIPGGDTTL